MWYPQTTNQRLPVVMFWLKGLPRMSPEAFFFRAYPKITLGRTHPSPELLTALNAKRNGFCQA